jgi:hypothetical protein
VLITIPFCPTKAEDWIKSPTFIQNLKEIFPRGVAIIVKATLTVKEKYFDPAEIVGTIDNESFVPHIEDPPYVVVFNDAEFYQVTHFH